MSAGCSPSLQPWPVFAVEVEGHEGKVLYCERSRSAARYRAFQAYREFAWRCTFEEFMRFSRIRRVPQPGRCIDGYAYVRQCYRDDIAIGQQVSFTGEMGLVGERGVIVYPGSWTAHVRVVLASGRDTCVHPSSIVMAA